MRIKPGILQPSGRRSSHWANPSSSWTWNIIASWWISLHPLLLYSLDKTNTQDKSCHFLCSTCSSGLLSYPRNIHSHMLYLSPLYHLNCSSYSPFIHSPTSTLASNISLNSPNMLQYQTSHLLFSLPEIFSPWGTHMICCLTSCRFLLKYHLIIGLLT